MPTCLKCERTLEFEFKESVEDNGSPISFGGFLEASFHYGSRHDRCWSENKKVRIAFSKDASRLDKILVCDKIQGYICDDCFEANLHLFEGWNDATIPVEKRIV